MEFNPTFYEENPFVKPVHFRIAGAATMDRQQLFALFVKNLIAFVYFHWDAKSYKETFKEKIPKSSEFSQLNLYNLFLKGDFVLTTNRKSSGVFHSFGFDELTTLKKTQSLDSIRYCDFITSHKQLLHRIDLLSKQDVNSEAGTRYLSYLSDYGILYTHINLVVVGNFLEHFFVEVCKKLYMSYIYHFDESGFSVTDLEKEMRKIEIALKLDLLDEEEQKELVEYSTRWITQRFKEFYLSNDLQYPIHATEGPFLFDAVLHYFATYFSKQTGVTKDQPTSQEPVYPTYIFTSYQGYLLFDTLAQNLTVKTSVSYVYRLLFEKGMIVAKDAAFREWYNQQSYPIELHSTTETLLNSKTTDREQFVHLVAKLLRITL